MKLINLTPHAVAIYSADGKQHLVTVPPSGQVARVSVVREPCGYLNGVPLPEPDEDGNATAAVPVSSPSYGQPEGVPPAESGVAYVVSLMVRQALSHRSDLLSPGDLVRNEAGQPVGCRGLDCN